MTTNNYGATGFALRDFWQALPPSMAALLVLGLGIGAAVIVRFAAVGLLERMRFNTLCDRLGVSEFLRKGEVSYSPARLLGVGAYWVVLLGAFLWTLHLLGVEVITVLFRRFEAALPTLLAATAIMVLGLAIVSFLAKVVRTLARNAAFPYADLLARMIKWAGVFLVIALAVEELGVGTHLMVATFQIVLGATALGLALAFGLGCKDLAREAMVKWLHHLKEKHRNVRPDLEG
jgi:hypothetical protein